MKHDALAFRKVWRVGANIDTDALAPGAYMKHGIEVIAAHCLEVQRPHRASALPKPRSKKVCRRGKMAAPI